MNRPDAQSREILACLGDSSRFRLVLSVLERERCVSELAVNVGLSQSCTTRHLQYLKREGIVVGVRQGKRVVFRLQSDRPRVRELLDWVLAAPSVDLPQAGDGSGDGAPASTSEARNPEPPAGNTGEDAQSRPTPGEPVSGSRSAEMEDWLL